MVSRPKDKGHRARDVDLVVKQLPSTDAQLREMVQALAALALAHMQAEASVAHPATSAARRLTERHVA